MTAHKRSAPIQFIEQHTGRNTIPGKKIVVNAIDARVLIGIHNDLFAGNRVSPGMLFDELDRRAPFMRCHLLQPGELYLYAG